MTSPLDAVRAHIANHPRSQQKAIGPSEVGTPCDRRLGYKLAGVEGKDDRDGWLPTIGTATHTWLEGALEAENKRLGRERFLIERKMALPLPGGETLGGKIDFYDTDDDSVNDWKVVGATTLKEAKRGRVDTKYIVQAQIYGLGMWWERFDVKTINIIFVPRNAPLRDTVIHTVEFDKEFAADAIARLDDIQLAVKLLDVEALPNLKTTNDRCNYCPFFNLASTDARTSCPGSEDYRLQVTSVGGLVGTTN
ncbi:MAG: hypothetical protein WC054_02265 [Candidatus Nanopelagicales bacterium]